MDLDPVLLVRRAARAAARATDAPLVLAVSGGLDSMVLLHAMAAVARGRIAAVATLDHGTGPAATRAASAVARAASALGLPVVVGHDPARGRAADGPEAAWREARRRFLREVAAPVGGRVVTAHTEDDQIETVLMRVMRGSGTRGLAALQAPGPVMRPFVGVRRRHLRRYALEEGVRWMEDPSNRSTALLRNRVRRELLPALRRVHPAIDAELLDLAGRAASWRRDVEALVDARLRPTTDRAGVLRVGKQELAGFDEDSLAVLWSALAGRTGLALDRRGTRRLAAFTMREPVRGTVPLAGGWCMNVRGADYIIERRRIESPSAVLPRAGDLAWGAFRFRVAEPAAREGDERVPGGTNDWMAALPASGVARVRRWRAGDRLAAAAGRPRRRVKRHLSEAGVHGPDRAEWPVVVAEGEDDVVWIPGVRRADAATERSGGPVRHYVCERIDR